MKIASTRFPDLDLPAAAILTFPEGILGFPLFKKYALLDNPGGGPFQWLQCAEEPALAFPCCNPLLVAPDYSVSVRPEELRVIELDNVAGAVVLVILVVPPDPRKMTANLQGPIVINAAKRLARQIVLGDEYPLRHLVFAEEPARKAKGP